MDQVGKLPEHVALGSLAATGHAEQQVRAVSGGIVVHGINLTRGRAHEITLRRESRMHHVGRNCDATRVPTADRAEAGVGHPPRVKSASRPTFPDRVLILLINRAGSKTLQETRLLLIRHAETSAPDVFHGAESDIGLSDWGRRQAGLARRTPENPGCRRPLLLGHAAGHRHRPPGRARPAASSRPSSPCSTSGRSAPSADCPARRAGTSTPNPRGAGWPATWNSPTKGASPSPPSAAASCRWWRQIAVRHRGQTVIVIAHGIVIRVLLLSLLDHLQPADFDRIAIDFASINDLRWDGQRWRAHALNQVVAPSPAKPVA